jgi:hypothetical protein
MRHACWTAIIKYWTDYLRCLSAVRNAGWLINETTVGPIPTGPTRDFAPTAARRLIVCTLKTSAYRLFLDPNPGGLFSGSW